MAAGAVCGGGCASGLRLRGRGCRPRRRSAFCAAAWPACSRARATQAEWAAALQPPDQGTICGAARWSLPPRTATSWTARSTRSSLPPLPSERALPCRSIQRGPHLLTRATLQVEALRVVHAGEPRVQADFADVGATLGEALDTVRASVHTLRESSVDLSVQMRKAVADVAAAAPLAVELDVRCDRVPPNACSCLLAVTREALGHLNRALAERVRQARYRVLPASRRPTTARREARTARRRTARRLRLAWAWPPCASASRRWAGPSGPVPARTVAGGSLLRCPRAAPGGERHENRNHRRRPSGL